jgi:hypothetical protein
LLVSSSVCALSRSAASLSRSVWVMKHFGNGDPEVLGVLSAIGFVWLYEKRENDHRHERLCERIDQLTEMLSDMRNY